MLSAHQKCLRCRNGGRSRPGWVLLLVAIVAATPIASPSSPKDATGQSAKEVSVAVGDLRATFVDNSALGEEHRAGYNGIARLTHAQQDQNVFVPTYAGFNLEHVFGGDRLEEVFEPRRHPMTLRRLSTATVVLHQNPTPLSSVESTTRFTVVPPHYIDAEFRCQVRDAKFFRHGYVGLLWASYINAPDDRRMHFRGRGQADDVPLWISASSPEHGVASTHLSLSDPGGIFFAPDFNATLASHFSDYRFTEPLFYGRFRNMVLIYMFERSEGIRFSQSPNGGGEKNPAWDFQLILRDFQVNKPYSYRARLVYKPFVSPDDVLDELRRWRRSPQP